MAKFNPRCLLTAVGISVVLAACGESDAYFPSAVADVPVEIVRFDSALLAVRTDSVVYDVRRLYAAYPEFMPLFVEGILGIPVADTAFLCAQLTDFLTDTVFGFAQTNRLVRTRFADIRPVRAELQSGFGRMHWLYPNLPVPSVCLFVSGFNSSLFSCADWIAVGVDMYLGSDYPYYTRVVYEYQKQTMRPECIATDVLSLYVAQNIPFTSRSNRLLEQMVYRGKQMWLLSRLLPDRPDYEIMGYTQAQWQWCERCERDIWNHIMDRRDLFRTESAVLSSYINDGPFTAEVSQDSPGRLGTWVGWRIVDSYMRHNSSVSIQQLMANGDAQQILEQSYYKP